MALRKTFVINLSLAFGAILLCLLLFEIGLRLFDSNSTSYAAATDESLFWRTDSLLGWTMQPNAKGKFIRPEFETHIETNSLGLRDDEVRDPKPRNEFRILLLGDSVVAGFEVERGETLEAQLEKLLNVEDTDAHFDVINAGCRGYGTDQTLLFLESVGFDLKPDLVVLAFVPANDLENNVTVHTAGRVYAKPFFTYAADSTLLPQGIPVPRDFPKEVQRYSPVVEPAPPALNASTQQTGSASLKNFLAEHLRLYSFLARRLKSGPAALVSWLNKAGVLHLNVPEAWVEFYRRPIPPQWQARWRISLDLLKAMAAPCEQRDIPFLVWMFPLKEQMYERDREIFLRSYGLKRADYDFDLPQEVLSQFCRDHGILFYSPLREMREKAAAGQRFHFVTDNHFNAAGHREIANQLAEFLRRQRLIPTDEE